MKALITFSTDETHFQMLNIGLLEADIETSIGRWFVQDCIAEAIETLVNEVA